MSFEDLNLKIQLETKLKKMKAAYLNVKNTQTRIPLKLPELKKQVRSLQRIIGIEDWEMSVWFTTDSTMRRYNRGLRNVDKATDVLSIPSLVKYTEPGKPVPLNSDKYLGDIMLGMPYIFEHCRKINRKLERHMPVLLTHGMCHLMGYTHDRDRDYEIMFKREKQILHEFWREYPELKLKSREYWEEDVE